MWVLGRTFPISRLHVQVTAFRKTKPVQPNTEYEDTDVQSYPDFFISQFQLGVSAVNGHPRLCREVLNSTKFITPLVIIDVGIRIVPRRMASQRHIAYHVSVAKDVLIFIQSGV